MPRMSFATPITHDSAAGRADDVLRRARAVWEPVLREAVDSLPAALRTMAGYHFGWWDEQGVAVVSNGGKAIRPGLAVAAATACGRDPLVAAPVAAAVELLHNFTLIHDDVMDADSTRRGRPTVWKLWGIGNAMLLGDALHAVAQRTSVAGSAVDASARISVRLSETAVELCGGQYDDCAFETRRQVTVDDWCAMAMAKTGALLGAATALGALAAAADPATIAAFEKFGRQLGLAFQAVDDLIGIWGDPAVTGKPVGADVARRKRSLPVAVALESGTSAGDELADLYCSEEPMTPPLIARATALIEDAGGRQWVRRYAEERTRAALGSLSADLLSADLTALAELSVHRNR